MNIGLTVPNEGSIYKLSIPYTTQRARRGAVVLLSGDGKDPLDLPKSKLESLVKGIVWRDQHFAGKSFIEIARENNCSRTFVMQLIDKSFEIA